MEQIKTNKTNNMINELKLGLEREIKRIERFLDEEAKSSHNIDYHKGMLKAHKNTISEIDELLKHSKEDSYNDLSFSCMEEAYDYYWDESRNPNGNYETEQALIDGELIFCVKQGYHIAEWIEYGKQRNK
jgi:adenine-specific DNA methylase